MSQCHYPYVDSRVAPTIPLISLVAGGSEAGSHTALFPHYPFGPSSLLCFGSLGEPFEQARLFTTFTAIAPHKPRLYSLHHYSSSGHQCPPTFHRHLTTTFALCMSSLPAQTGSLRKVAVVRPVPPLGKTHHLFPRCALVRPLTEHLPCPHHRGHVESRLLRDSRAPRRVIQQTTVHKPNCVSKSKRFLYPSPHGQALMHVLPLVLFVHQIALLGSTMERTPWSRGSRLLREPFRSSSSQRIETWLRALDLGG